MADRSFKTSIPHVRAEKKYFGHRKLLELVLHGVVFGNTLRLLYSKLAAGDKTRGISPNNFPCAASAAWHW